MVDRITETFAYDHGRQVTVRVPPEPADALVLAADGQRTVRWARALAGPTTLLVGLHGLDDETARLHEYSPGFDPDRFAAHERFAVDEVLGWVRARFDVDPPAARTAVFGASAGGELALALGLRHPDVFGAVLCASPGAGFQPGGALPDPLPRAYLVAGDDEPFFRDSAMRWADALRDAGGEVVMAERPGTHGRELWQAELPAMRAWFLGEDDD